MSDVEDVGYPEQSWPMQDSPQNPTDFNGLSENDHLIEHESQTNSIREAENDSQNVTELETDSDLELNGDNFFSHFDPSLYDSEIAITPHYEGAKVTLLQALAEIFDWFTSHPGTSKESLSRILHLQHHSLLPSNMFPDNYTSALKMISPFLIKLVTIHACPNDCILFRNEYSDLSSCPTCGRNRYKRDLIPERRFVYMPLGPRLERLFGTSNLAQIVQAHDVPSNSNSMYDIQDSPAWKEAYSSTGIFNGDARGIALALYGWSESFQSPPCQLFDVAYNVHFAQLAT